MGPDVKLRGSREGRGRGARPHFCLQVAGGPTLRARSTRLQAAAPPAGGRARSRRRGRGLGMGGDVSPGGGALRAPLLARGHLASGPGLPRKRPHRTPAPGPPSPEARSRPRTASPAPGSAGREVGRGGCAARGELTPGRAAPSPGRPPARPAAAPFILGAPSQCPRAPPSARPRRPGRERRACAAHTCSASGPAPCPRPGRRWPWPPLPGACLPDPGSQRALPGASGSALARPTTPPRAPGAARADGSPAAPSAARARRRAAGVQAQPPRPLHVPLAGAWVCGCLGQPSEALALAQPQLPSDLLWASGPHGKVSHTHGSWDTLVPSTALGVSPARFHP